MKKLVTSSCLFLLFIILMASCQSSQPMFSKPGEAYQSAREIAEQKRQERKLRKIAGRNGTKKAPIASKSRSKRNRIAKSRILDKDIAKVIKTARSYTGTPYKWGGTTRVGMDCSGLLCTSFQSINVQLPRTSEEQSDYGKKVRMKDLQEGDLVFFGASKNSRQVTHVGMVTEVNGKQDIRFIHASSSLGVIENNLFSNHYQNIFIKAVRPHHSKSLISKAD